MNQHPATETIAAWSGLDVAKDTFAAALYLPQPAGDPPRAVAKLPQRNFERSPEGVGRWLAWCDHQLGEYAAAAGLEQPPPLRAGMEATGRYSLELAAWIARARPQVAAAIIDPLGAHHYAKSLRMRNKTDKVDAAVLARMGYERRFAPSEQLPPAYAELRAMTRERDHLMGQLQATSLRAGEIEAWPAMLKIQRQLIAALRQAIKKVDRALAAHVRLVPELAEAVRLLCTIPGVGRLTAMVVLAELGDLRRFETSRQVTSFAGLNPKLFESGDSVHYQAHLSKQGPARVRQALYMSSLSVLRGQTPLRECYERLRGNGKCKMSALGAVMRKQLVLMRAVLVGGSDYDPQFVKQPPSQLACG